MKIKTKTGEILDLDEAKARLSEIEAQYQDDQDVRIYDGLIAEWTERYGEVLLDALVAALSVPRSDANTGHGSHDDFARCYNGALDEVSQAAGVVEAQ